jgi:predicted PurR-regulated permease PerM
VSWIVNIALAFVISCYLLWDKNGILSGLKRLVSVFFNERHSKIIFRTTKECNRIFSKYIIGKALDSLIIGILCFICMSILKLPYALLISVFVGITNMIPYFGPFIGAIPGVLLLLIVSPKMCIIFAILIFLLQQFDGSILGPKIIGNSTGLAPIGVIFGILAGGYVAGVVGMFIGVPVVAVLIYIINKLIDTHIYHRKLREDPNYVEPKFIMQMTDEELGFEYDAQE